MPTGSRTKELWKDPCYRRRMLSVLRSPERRRLSSDFQKTKAEEDPVAYKASKAKAARVAWKNYDKMHSAVSAGNRTPEKRASSSSVFKKLHADPIWHAKSVRIATETHSTPEARLRHSKVAIRERCKGRSSATALEAKLALYLALDGFEFQMEHGIPEAGTVADAAIPERKIAIFADGTYWHSRHGAKMADHLKKMLAQRAGWMVYRLSEENFDSDYQSMLREIA